MHQLNIHPFLVFQRLRTSRAIPSFHIFLLGISIPRRELASQMEMAVHAHYHPSSNLINLLHLHRTSDHQEGQGNNERMDLRFPHSDSVTENLGKRSREDVMMAVPTSQYFSRQLNHHSGLVSTGLCLSLDEQQQQQHHQFQVSSVCSRFSSELADQIARHNTEIDQFLIQQGEQLRRELAEKRRRQYNALLLAAEELIARKLREKQAEIKGAAELTQSLESQLKQVRSESAAWQSKALAEQATATTLHAQLQQATATATAAAAESESGWGSDAESGFVDPKRVEAEGSCRACGLRAASVVIFPCRHLCLCEGCEGKPNSNSSTNTCPVCCSVRSGTLKVFFQ